MGPDHRPQPCTPQGRTPAVGRTATLRISPTLRYGMPPAPGISRERVMLLAMGTWSGRARLTENVHTLVHGLDARSDAVSTNPSCYVDSFRSTALPGRWNP